MESKELLNSVESDTTTTSSSGTSTAVLLNGLRNNTIFFSRIFRFLDRNGGDFEVYSKQVRLNLFRSENSIKN